MLAHNHPSGNLLPSSADVKSTILLEKCLRKIGITLIDHIIVAGEIVSKVV
ncbi:MAG: JAB domain-containing protein [Lentisphaeria bacterium]|nr:JAB domain-containing protein [Lentisphaeria bacterium]